MKAFNILLAVPLFLVAIIWSYFTRANDNVHSICTICKTKVIGGNRQSNFGTSSLISHLRTNHSAAYQDFSSRQLNFKRPSSVSSVTSAMNHQVQVGQRSPLSSVTSTKVITQKQRQLPSSLAK